MSATKTVPLTLPENVWGRLASKADREGVTLADLIASAVAGLLPPERERPVPPTYPDGFTGVPGHRLDVLAAELSDRRRKGTTRMHDIKRSLAA